MNNTLMHDPILFPQLVGPSFLNDVRRKYHPSGTHWAYSPFISYYEGFDKNYILPEGMVSDEAGSMNRTIHRSRPEVTLPDEFDLLMHPIYNIEEMTRVRVEEVDRMMVNFYWPKPKTDEQGNTRVYGPHQDYDHVMHPMYSAIINISEDEDVAPTYFFHHSILNGNLKMDLVHTVHLNAGDCVVFPSYLHHAAGHCDKNRQNINLVFKTETKIGTPS